MSLLCVFYFGFANAKSNCFKLGRFSLVREFQMSLQISFGVFDVTKFSMECYRKVWYINCFLYSTIVSNLNGKVYHNIL